jgi:Cu+-exporting ATPase
VGITLADDINNFTPACDAILDAKRLQSLPQLLRLAKSGRTIINTSFIVSILYNIIGLSIAMQGNMSPMIAAILMPASTLTIVLITSCTSSLIAKGLGLSLKSS